VAPAFVLRATSSFSKIGFFAWTVAALVHDDRQDDRAPAPAVTRGLSVSGKPIEVSPPTWR
jgi:hypothetical protein